MASYLLYGWSDPGVLILIAFSKLVYYFGPGPELRPIKVKASTYFGPLLP
ncbi:MAG: hypothetical protein IPI00_16305 [Flavobacteriales bacterium]|nr:hypothetical protein [Flavobacteriales bacterium]MBK6945569.1 hypothetical protein [Flavobacteriales bacterium]MBK7241686.1 hypothetical protein [Flavobacteriales bacterium]MBK7296329.1 hypothetical protein [Flavobacteriales bacterium]MBK9534875.1 hypothetical protein [Flavobacteriales bacterium]